MTPLFYYILWIPASPSPHFLDSNPCAHTTLMSWNILSGGRRSQSYHFNLISIKKIISLLRGLTAANGFRYHKGNFEDWNCPFPHTQGKRKEKKARACHIFSLCLFIRGEIEWQVKCKAKDKKCAADDLFFIFVIKSSFVLFFWQHGTHNLLKFTWWPKQQTYSGLHSWA